MSDSEEPTGASAASQASPPLPSQLGVAMQAAPLIQGITPPKPRDTTTNIAENWKQFKQIWENYAIITNLTAQADQYRVALFLHCLGPDAMKIYNGTQFANETDRRTLSKVNEKFDEFTIGEVNETYERYIFNGRNQGQDESIDAYITALRSLAITCGSLFCDCLADSLLRDLIVLGINNHALRKRLLQERNLDLKTCIDLCRSSEAASSQTNNISGASSTKNDVHRLKVQPTKSSLKLKYDRNAKHHKHQKRKISKFCAGNHPLKKELCPVWQKRCQKWNGRNHFATVCKKGQARGVQGLSEQPELDSDEHDDSYESSDYEFLDVMAAKIEQTSGYAREIYTKMMINDKKSKFQIDCGASINIITKCHPTRSYVTPSNKTLKMWMGQK